jgi:hypothetical protein
MSLALGWFAPTRGYLYFLLASFAVLFLSVARLWRRQDVLSLLVSAFRLVRSIGAHQRACALAMIAGRMARLYLPRLVGRAGGFEEL